jgi:spermidine synthase
MSVIGWIVSRRVDGGAFLLGGASMVAQLALLREFLDTFAGNELIVAFVLGYWFVLTALGAVVGIRGRQKRSVLGGLIGLELGAAVAPVLQILAIRVLRALLVPGVAPGPGLALGSTALILLPGCLVQGWLFSAWVRLAVEERGREDGRVYLGETLGLAAGGLGYTLFLCERFGSFELAGMIAILNSLAAAWLAASAGRRVLAWVAILTPGVLVSALSLCDLDRRTLAPIYAGATIVAQVQSPYGHLVVTEVNGQRAFFQQGTPLFTTQDTAAREERIHFALAQREHTGDVLLVGGVACRAADEALKYAPRRVDCVDPDPAVLRAVREAGGAMANDSRVRFIETDARRYLVESPARYDAIILGLPAPETIQFNRFFTREFFAEAAARLEPDGVLAMTLPGSEGAFSPGQKDLLASVHAALLATFRHTCIIPGENTILLGSGGPLVSDVTPMLKHRRIPVLYMTEGYLASRLTPERQNAVRAAAGSPVPPNTDFAPSSHGHALRLWLEKSGGSLLWPAVVFTALVTAIGAVLSVSGSRRVAATIASTGFAGISLEVVLVLAFQVLYGSLYLHLGALFAVFMVGTAAGALAALRHGVPGGVRGLGLLDAGLVILAPVSAVGLQGLAAMRAPPGVGPLFIGFGLLATGFVVGAQFPLAVRMPGKEREGSGFFYAADLAGACLGAFATAAILLPALGFVGTCWLLAAIKFASLVGLWGPSAAEDEEEATDRGRRVARWAATGFLVLAGVLIVSEETALSLYAASFSNLYVFAVLVAMGLAFWATGFKPAALAEAGDPSVSRALARRLGFARPPWISVARAVNYVLFGLVAFFPIFRCYFRIPYLFCHVCPRQCIFGYLRPYLVGGALLTNLGQAPFCRRVCPVGACLDAQAPSTPVGPRLRRLLGGVRWVVLVAVVLLYFGMERSFEGSASGPGRLYTALFRNDYAADIWVIAAAGGILLLGRRIRRVFCLALCPIGATSELAEKVLRRIPAKRDGAQGGAEGPANGPGRPADA